LSQPGLNLDDLGDFDSTSPFASPICRRRSENGGLKNAVLLTAVLLTAVLANGGAANGGCC